MTFVYVERAEWNRETCFLKSATCDDIDIIPAKNIWTFDKDDIKKITYDLSMETFYLSEKVSMDLVVIGFSVSLPFSSIFIKIYNIDRSLFSN